MTADSLRALACAIRCGRHLQARVVRGTEWDKEKPYLPGDPIGPAHDAKWGNQYGIITGFRSRNIPTTTVLILPRPYILTNVVPQTNALLVAYRPGDSGGPAVADVLNKHFVCIKVDREERPDVDDVYMTAMQVAGELMLLRDADRDGRAEWVQRYAGGFDRPQRVGALRDRDPHAGGSQGVDELDNSVIHKISLLEPRTENREDDSWFLVLGSYVAVD